MKRILSFSFIVSFLLVGLLEVCQGQQEVSEQILSVNGGSSLDKFGESVAISGDFAIVGAPGDNGSSKSSGAAYILTHNGSSWIITQKLIASDSAGFSKFGQSVAISGNYAIIGAYGNNGNGSFSGAAYIFHYNGVDWVELQKITANDASSWKKFGLSVAISDNFAIVGACGDNDRGESAGATYIFHFDGSNWSQSQKLTAFDGEPWDQFGQSVAISGDYAVIGAHGNSDNGPLSGSAYIFYYNGNNWLQYQKLIANDGSPWDNLGKSVAISANVAIVSAYKDNDKGESSGSAYVFFNDGNDWLFEQKLTASDGVASDFFGSSVSVYGDYAMVGAYGDDDNGILSGSAYIFSFNGNSWSQTEKLAAENASASDYFGKSVAIYEDRAVVGAYGYDFNGENTGSTYLYNNFTIPFPEITPSSDISRVVIFDASRYTCDEIVYGVAVGQSCDYQWNFGGTGTIIGGNSNDNIVVQYDSPGIYDIILTVTEKSAGILKNSFFAKASAININSLDIFADFTPVVSGHTITINKSFPANIVSVEIFWGDRTVEMLNISQQAHFSWVPNQETNLAGYKIYYGTVSGAYDHVVDVGNPVIQGDTVQATVGGLADETTYYFAATAYDRYGFESDYSGEVVWTSPSANNIVLSTAYSNPITVVMEHTYSQIGNNYNIRILTVDSNGNELIYSGSDYLDLNVYISN